MPFSDAFAQDILFFQDDDTLALTVTTNTATERTVSSTGFDPKNSTPITERPYVAVPFLATVPDNGVSANTSLTGLYHSGQVLENLSKEICSYGVTFTGWDFSDQTQNNIITFGTFILSNTTSSDILFSGVEVFDAALSDTVTGFPNSTTANVFRLTKSADVVGTFPVYTCDENFTFTKGHRIILQTGSEVTYQHQVFDENSFQRFVPSVTLPGAPNTGDTIDVHNGGKFSVARFNFPNVFILKPGDSISVSLGTLTLNFNSEVIT